MKKIFSKWWDFGNKNFQIVNYKKSWKEYGIVPKIRFRTNGARRKNGDNCFDAELVIGYTCFMYTNFNLQRNKFNKK